MNSQNAFAKESTPKIGIVIPIYNVAPYLVECLDSVLNQTYKNFYAVLVNDGSTDDSKSIALDFVAKDSRFILIDKENGGLSSARNAGINYFKSFAKGAESNKNNLVILSEAKYLKKKDRDSSPTAQNDKIMGGAESSKQIAESNLDSANHIKSLDSATIHTHKNTAPNPPQIDYIIFLDSDDFWEANLLQTCVDSAKSQNLDIIWFNYQAFYDSTEWGGGVAHLIARKIA